MKVKESLNVTFDKSPAPTKLSPLVDDDVGEEEAIESNIKIVNNNNIENESIEVDKFEMSMMEDFNFFLCLQIKQMEDGIFFNQSKYIKEMLKKFGLEDSKQTKTPMSREIKLTKDDEAESVDSTKYRALAISTTEAEYVSARKACQQALWMKQALIDYDIRLKDVLIMCDNKGAIDLS
ncbi:copia protein [Tanacetum coccineum]